MSINAGLMSSLTDEWATPQELFDELNAEFNFTLDVCADDWNYKVDNYYTKEIDGLAQNWNGTIWCNPPYGREIKHWIKKGYEASLTGSTVVMLIPARTDTAYWHEYVMNGEIRFIRGRIKFVDRNGGGQSPAPFPSAVVVFRGVK